MFFHDTPPRKRRVRCCACGVRMQDRRPRVCSACVVMVKMLHASYAPRDARTGEQEIGWRGALEALGVDAERQSREFPPPPSDN